MKAMIFAAGLGTRLRPLTNDRPKALVEVAGKPMLQHVIEKFIAVGVTEIVVNVHHFADKIIDFLADNNNFGITIHVSDERERLLDTGGAILKARQWLYGNEPFMVHNADIITDLDLLALEKSHVESGASATLLVAPRETSRYLLFDENMKLQGWQNVSTGDKIPADILPEDYQSLAFGGVHILSPSIFKTLETYSEDEKFSIVSFYVSACRNLLINGYLSPVPYHWLDIGKPETIHQADALLSQLDN